jgi:hypothetical protein
MLSWAFQIIATLVLLTCFVCPLVELFDYWDDSLLTGNDTEYGLVLLALCVGVEYTFVRIVVKSWTVLDFLSRSIFASGADEASWSETGHCRKPLFEDRSPPGLLLRL